MDVYYNATAKGALPDTLVITGAISSSGCNMLNITVWLGQFLEHRTQFTYSLRTGNRVYKLYFKDREHSLHRAGNRVYIS